MQSMEEIYKEHAKCVFRYLMSLTGDSFLAEELTQETFYQAITCIHRFDGSCKITTWLCAIARNQYLVYRRKHPATEQMEMVELQAEASVSVEQEVLIKQGQEELLRKLHALPEPFREILHLRLYGELSFREIGDVFGKTENWARVNFYRGKERLRKEMEEDEK